MMEQTQGECAWARGCEGVTWRDCGGVREKHRGPVCALPVVLVPCSVALDICPSAPCTCHECSYTHSAQVGGRRKQERRQGGRGEVSTKDIPDSHVLLHPHIPHTLTPSHAHTLSSSYLALLSSRSKSICSSCCWKDPPSSLLHRETWLPNSSSREQSQSK